MLSSRAPRSRLHPSGSLLRGDELGVRSDAHPGEGPGGGRGHGTAPTSASGGRNLAGRADSGKTVLTLPRAAIRPA
jgi:hypothetical protein